jgi:UDPglucose 6-dehydrogenase
MAFRVCPLCVSSRPWLSSSGVDKDKARVDNLNKGIPPLFEPGLSDLVLKNINNDRLKYTTDLEVALKGARYFFIAFDTRVDDNDDVNLSDVWDAVSGSTEWLEDGSVVVISSQIPVGTCEETKDS